MNDSDRGEFEACPNATLSNTNPKITGVGISPDVRGERPKANSLAGSNSLLRYPYTWIREHIGAKRSCNFSAKRGIINFYIRPSLPCSFTASFLKPSESNTYILGLKFKLLVVFRNTYQLWVRDCLGIFPDSLFIDMKQVSGYL